MVAGAAMILPLRISTVAATDTGGPICRQWQRHGRGPLREAGIERMHLMHAQVRRGIECPAAREADRHEDMDRAVSVAEEDRPPCQRIRRAGDRGADVADEGPVEQVRRLNQSEGRVPPISARGIGDPEHSIRVKDRRIAHDIREARPARGLPYGIAAIERPSGRSIGRDGDVEPLVAATAVGLEMRHDEPRLLWEDRSLRDGALGSE